jgi:uncharacterized protein YecE (DUF72 family)
MLRAGTSGFSYAPWKSTFYPEGLPAKRWLAYYAERLPAVEINNTFYRMPKASVLAGWAEQVPQEFRFAVKASKRITHIKRLKEVGDEVGYLVTVLAALGPKLGAVLFQLPPNLKLDLPRLEAFHGLLAGRVPAAFEFRHPSWQEPAVAELLRAHGAALCVADVDDEPAPALVATGPSPICACVAAPMRPASWPSGSRSCGSPLRRTPMCSSSTRMRVSDRASRQS